jgi:hypothetical protein
MAINDEAKLVEQVVSLGRRIRAQRREGSLRSVPPPTIYGYLAFLRMARDLPHLSLQQIGGATLVGNAVEEDQKLAASILNEVFGLRSLKTADPVEQSGLF